MVDVFDLLVLLGNFGNTPPADTTGDITGPSGVSDGLVDVLDLLALLGMFGQDCPTP